MLQPLFVAPENCIPIGLTAGQPRQALHSWPFLLYCHAGGAQSRLMLTPQFSLRRLLLIVTVSAVLCLIPAVATRGYLWAVGLALALVGVFVLAGIQILLFALSRVAGMYVERQQARAGRAPKA
jgi:hypothetical protein